MIVIHFNLWHESSSPLFLPGLFVNVLAALLASGGAALTLKETINQVPVFLLKILSRIGDFAKYSGIKNPPLTSFRLDNLLTPMVHDLTILEEIVGPLPYDMDSGIKHTLDWMTSSTKSK